MSVRGNKRDMDAEQVARNDAIFRDSNERIREAAEDYDHPEQVPFICECARPECREVILLSLAEYERVRSDASRFIVAPGHEASAKQHARIVEEKPSYHVVQKIGAATEVAVELDPRGS